MLPSRPERGNRQCHFDQGWRAKIKCYTPQTKRESDVKME